METKRIKLTDLVLNEGQVAGLPTNPRQWTKTELDKLKKSLQETPELLEARGILVYPWEGKYLVLGGNMRLSALKALKATDAPCIVFPEGTPIDKLKEIVIKDNGSFGDWDYDALGNQWDDLPLGDWGVPAWDTGQPGLGVNDALSSAGGDGGDGYDEFVDKFKQKLTTDDCYTPTEVFETLLGWIDEKVKPIDREKIVRPFFPGGDYQSFKYPDDCVVIDNPPFSIYSKIVRFYAERKIPFFLFGPALSLFTPGKIPGVCYIVSNVGIVYENGAVVSTSFVTNIIGNGDLIWVRGDLRERITDAQKKDEVELTKYNFPDNVLTSARLGKICNNAKSDLRINYAEAENIKQLDGLKALGKGLFGGGFLLSRAAAERAAAERAAAEQAAAERAAAERAAAERAAINIELSQRELAIINKLE